MPYVEYDEVGAACADCGRQFPSAEALEAHRADSHAGAELPARPKGPLRCSVCNRTFRSLGALAEHSRRDHSG